MIFLTITTQQKPSTETGADGAVGEAVPRVAPVEQSLGLVPVITQRRLAEDLTVPVLPQALLPVTHTIVQVSNNKIIFFDEKYPSSKMFT